MAWYKTGTVAVTNGSTTVTGTGTDFINGARAGDGFKGPDGEIYEIASITSATVLVIAEAYGGSTASGQSYAIVIIQSRVKDLADSATTLVNNFTLAGAGKFSDGTVGAPGIAFSADLNTGLYRIGNDNLGVAVGGSKILGLTSTGIDVTGTVSADNLTVDTNTLYVDATNNTVGIGTSQPSTKLHVQDSLGSPQIRIDNQGTAYGIASLLFVSGGAGNPSSIIQSGGTQSGNQGIVFKHGNYGSENVRARLDSSGNWLVGTPSALSAGKISVAGGTSASGITATTAATGGYSAASFQRTASDGQAVQFKRGTAEVGSIYVTSSATAYNTSSDYRLKEDIKPVENATDRLLQLKPIRFKWKSDGTRVDGFLAHEAQQVVPESVTGEKDGMRTEEYVKTPALGDIYIPEIAEAIKEVKPAIAQSPDYFDKHGNLIQAAVKAVPAVHEKIEGVPEKIIKRNVEQPEELDEGQQWRETSPEVKAERDVPDYQGIDQAKLVPLAIATIQEQQAKIDALTKRIEALEK